MTTHSANNAMNMMMIVQTQSPELIKKQGLGKVL
jgi:hypothetical protein